jgi:lipopolysaccharide export system protein LptC
VQRGERAPRDAAKTPDFYLEDFSATRFGKDGSVVQQLAAKKMTHYTEGIATDVVAPQLTNTPPGKAPMRIRADTGKVSPDNEDVYLTGNVIGIREAVAGKGQLTITTDYLHVRARDEKADTNKRVTLVDGNGTHVGGSLEVDNKARTIKLRNGVSGEIKAQPK